MKRRLKLMTAYALGCTVAFLLILDTVCMCIAYGEVRHISNALYDVPYEAVEYHGCGFCTVTADVLNIRSLPSMGGEIIGTLEQGEHVYKVMLCLDWCLVKRMGYQYPSGWVHSKYIH